MSSAPTLRAFLIQIRSDIIDTRDESALYAIVDRLIADEREACARIAESRLPSGFRNGTRGGALFGIARDDVARTIAYLIRQRDADN